MGIHARFASRTRSANKQQPFRGYCITILVTLCLARKITLEFGLISTYALSS